MPFKELRTWHSARWTEHFVLMCRTFLSDTRQPEVDFLKLLSRDFEQSFGHNVSLRVKTISNINLVASMHIKRETG